MMAINRHRLKHLATKGALGAKTTQGLLARTDELLSTVLIGNNLFNTGLLTFSRSCYVCHSDTA